MKKLFLILFLLPILSFAQNEFYNNGGSLYIEKGAMLHIQGSLTNTNDSVNATIQNDGTIELEGNFINTSGAHFLVFNDTTSKERAVKFIGSGKQLIEGSLATSDSASFYNLVIDKSVINDSVEMQTPVTLQGSLVFGTTNTTTTYNPPLFYTTNNNGGLLKTFNNTLGEFLLDIQNGDSDAISGYSTLAIGGSPTTNMILTRGNRGSANGGLQRKIANLQQYVYPIGTIDHGYNATALTFDSIPTGGGSVKAKFCDSTSGSTGSVGNITKVCIGCYGSGPITPPDNNGFNEYFITDPCNSRLPQWIILGDEVVNHGYWSFASTNLGYKYSIETFPNSFKMLGSIMDTWRTIKYPAAYNVDPSVDTANWEPYIESSISNVNDLLTFTRNSGCYTGDGIPGGIYTNFSHFRLSSAGGGNALPVELLYLNAVAIDNQFIRVSWSTTLEINNAGFKVMRSSDGKNFTQIAWVAGQDNSTSTEDYYSDDHNVTAGIYYYYKLIQMDNNGKAKETEIVTASLTSGSVFTVSEFIPNPAYNVTKLIINTSEATNITVKMFDMLGRKISDQPYQLTSGENELDFNTSLLSNGAYTTIINASDKVYSKSLVVIKN